MRMRRERGGKIIIYPRRTCAGGLQYLFCVCVCMSVSTLAATSVVSRLKMRYVGFYLRLFSVFNLWIFDKTFRSKLLYGVKKPKCKLASACRDRF